MRCSGTNSTKRFRASVRRNDLIDKLEERLDSFDSAERKEALAALYEKTRSGEIKLAETGRNVNMHCHSFFSYNAYGYSPSKCMARPQAGLQASVLSTLMFWTPGRISRCNEAA